MLLFFIHSLEGFILNHIPSRNLTIQRVTRANFCFFTFWVNFTCQLEHWWALFWKYLGTRSWKVSVDHSSGLCNSSYKVHFSITQCTKEQKKKKPFFFFFKRQGRFIFLASLAMLSYQIQVQQALMSPTKWADGSSLLDSNPPSAVWPWATYAASLCFSFLRRKLGRWWSLPHCPGGGLMSAH